ncbi:hypothetical protein HHK36_000826 [Tetracentron sinense]|uniref:PGG domain-containing protein n=1 Tax=Tetracentron sinense TaxID=13715 RepID=A0A834ZS82_TETSI|nr:hypothetical protein HHK36_000826 [Tetracentron sinense]
MDPRLFEAALTGNVGALLQLLQENPLILADAALLYPDETPLHVASKVGHFDFVREMIRQKPEFAREMNKDGFRPMDIASANGYSEIVRELLMVDKDLCRLKGRDRRTPLHYAAMKGRIEIIDELLSTCPDSAKDVTARGETALHLAVKNNQFEAFQILVQWLEQHNMEELLNWGDQKGNTVLHLVASRHQQEVPMKPTEQELQPESSKDWFKYFQFQVNRDSPSNTRSTLLVVAALIATVTFQAGVNPPSGFLNLKEETQSSSRSTNSTRVGPAVGYGLAALSAVLGSQAESSMFLFWNTLGLSASVSIIAYLTTRFPFQMELLISIISMMFTYGCSIASISSGGLKYTLVGIAAFIPYLLRWVPRWGKRFWEWWRRPSGMDIGAIFLGNSFPGIQK